MVLTGRADGKAWPGRPDLTPERRDLLQASSYDLKREVAREWTGWQGGPSNCPEAPAGRRHHGEYTYPRATGGNARWLDFGL